jgi:5-methylcytosine-specific restriction protein A
VTISQITEAQALACYEAARLQDGSSRNARAKEVNAKTKMSVSSANHYIKAVEQMRVDGHYNMTVNADATALYLEWIGRDDGFQAKIRAAKVTLRHVKYYAGLPKGGSQHAVRKMAEMILSADAGTPVQDETHKSTATPLSVLDKDFDERVGAAEALTDAELERRARQAASVPAKKIRTATSSFKRNEHVRVWVLRNAAGTCDKCKRSAPFLRGDGSPYLEHHHKLPLAEDGPDTVENSMALCPNCHREAHHGEHWKEFRS